MVISCVTAGRRHFLATRVRQADKIQPALPTRTSTFYNISAQRESRALHLPAADSWSFGGAAIHLCEGRTVRNRCRRQRMLLTQSEFTISDAGPGVQQRVLLLPQLVIHICTTWQAAPGRAATRRAAPGRVAAPRRAAYYMSVNKWNSGIKSTQNTTITPVLVGMINFTVSSASLTNILHFSLHK